MTGPAVSSLMAAAEMTNSGRRRINGHIQQPLGPTLDSAQRRPLHLDGIGPLRCRALATQDGRYRAVRQQADLERNDSQTIEQQFEVPQLRPGHGENDLLHRGLSNPLQHQLRISLLEFQGASGRLARQHDTLKFVEPEPEQEIAAGKLCQLTMRPDDDRAATPDRSRHQGDAGSALGQPPRHGQTRSAQNEEADGRTT